MAVALAQLPDWPAALDWEGALSYTGVGETQLRQWAKSGMVRFRPRGPRGAMIVQRSQLDAALAQMFGAASNDPSEDFDFGDA